MTDVHRPQVEQIWRELECEYQPVRLTARWDWISSWLDAYQDSISHWFAVATIGHDLIGVGLVTCSGPKPFRQRGVGLVHIGTSGEPVAQSVGAEYNDVIVNGEHRDAFARELLRTIRRQMRPVTIQLKAFAPEDAAAFLNASPSFRTQELRCPVFDLKKARDERCDPVSLLRSGVRSRIRRSIKTLQPLTTEWAATLPHAYEILDDLILLHQDRWNREGRTGAFSSAQLTAFHRRLIAKLLPKGEVILFRVLQHGKTVGCLYSLVDSGSVLFYQSGFAEFADNKIKPGLTTHMLCIEQCIARNFHTYNFLAGEHRYKDELATSECTLLNAQVSPHPIMNHALQYVFDPRVRETLRGLLRWRERVILLLSGT
jgi:hypothetical protein